MIEQTAYQPTPWPVRLALWLVWTSVVIQVLVAVFASAAAQFVGLNWIYAALLLPTGIVLNKGFGAIRVPLILMGLLPWAANLLMGEQYGYYSAGNWARDLWIDAVRLLPQIIAGLLLFLPAANRWFAWQAECRALVAPKR